MPRHQFHLVTRWMTQFCVQRKGREEAVYDGEGDNCTLARCSKRLLTSHNKKTGMGNGNNVHVMLNVFDDVQLLRRAGSLFEVRLNTP